MQVPVPGTQVAQPSAGAHVCGAQSAIVPKPPLPSQIFSTVPSQRIVPAAQVPPPLPPCPAPPPFPLDEEEEEPLLLLLELLLWPP